MKLTVLYWKGTDVPVEYLLGNAKPTPSEILKRYAIVYDGDYGDKHTELSLDTVFSIFNGAAWPGCNPLAKPEGLDRLRELGVYHVSMSIGDIVEIEGQAYVCCALGWERIDYTHVPAAAFQGGPCAGL